jgi:YfiH family protein
MKHIPWSQTSCDGLLVYQSENLAIESGLVHGFTTRHGGISGAPYGSLNMGTNVDDEPANVVENRRRVAGAFGFAFDEIVTTKQVHGQNVVLVDSKRHDCPPADALIGNTPNILLMLMFADCVPVFLFDPEHRAIGLVHSGWKGTVANVVQAAIDGMSAAFGTRPSECISSIGPCIGVRRYEVRADVASYFYDLDERCSTNDGNSIVLKRAESETFHVDLRQAVFRQLLNAGIDVKKIAMSDHCTFSNVEDFYSHRRDTPGTSKTGRMAAFIGLVE